MKLPSNATIEENERFAYIKGDVYTAKLYEQLIEADEREVYIYNKGFDDGKEQEQIDAQNNG